MKIRVEVIKENEKPEDEKTLGVALHARRGDTMNVEQSRTIGEGDSLMIEMPSNGQVLLMGPDTSSNVVYDRATMANTIKPADARTGFVDEESKLRERKKAEDVLRSEAAPMTTTPATEPGTNQAPNTKVPEGQPNPSTPAKPVPDAPNKDGSATGGARVVRG